MKILIVDDHAENIELMMIMLTSQNFEVDAARNGREALDLLRSKEYDLIISDILMPVMDGFMFCRECKKDEKLRDICFVFYTATYVDEKDEEFALSLGAQKFIIKPQEPDAFINLIKEVIAESKNFKVKIAPIIEQDEKEVYKLYSERLVAKLEHKNFELQKEIELHKATEINLIESEERYSLAVEGSNDGLWDWNMATDMAYYSDRCTQMLGYEPDEVPGIRKVWFDLIHPDDKKIALQSIEDYLSQKTDHYESTYRMRNKDGYFRWITSRGKALFDNAGKPYRFVGFNMDITEKKEQELELLYAKQKAEESDRLKTAFLSNLSHEIRTPMNAIIGFTGLLKDKDLSNEKKLSYIGIIHKSGYHLLSIISDIVEISRIETGQVKVNYVPVSINSLVNDLHDIFMADIPADEITLRVLKASPFVDITVLSDEVKLRQILTNLISNAIKFTCKGSIEFGYEISDEIRFFVRDTGIGIHPEHHQIIFDRFRQIESDMTIKGGGTGIGLAICKAYAEMLGGQISVKSEVNIGSEFSVTIPFVKPRDSMTQEQQILQDTVPGREDNMLVLIVEDDDMNFYYLSELLAKKDYRLIRAGNGKEACDMVAAINDIKLVLLDIKMPVMDGYEALERIRLIKPGLPVIAQTAYALAEDCKKITQAGFDEYITKPIKKEQLFQILDKVLRSQ